MKVRWIQLWMSLLMFVGTFHPTLAQEPQRGGNLVMVISGDPAHLNPAIQSGHTVGVPGAQLFAAPLRFDDHWQPQPYLAEVWEISDDGLSVTLRLVKNATFHDGAPVTSEDVKFSLMTVKANHPFQHMFAPVESVETPDVHTVIIRLKHPHPAILMAMSSVLLPIIPKHIYGDGQDLKTHPANVQPVGSGPFKLKEFIPGKHIWLERHDNFFLEGTPYLDEIRMLILRDPDEPTIGLETGEVHLWSTLADAVVTEQLSKVEDLVIVPQISEALGGMTWLAFNLRKPPFNNLKVRQGIAHAIDRQFIIDALFQGKANIATGPISSGNPFYSDEVERYEVDFEKANRLLDEAGYPRNQIGKRFSFELISFNDPVGTTQKMMAYFHQVLLRKLGIEVEYKLYSFQEWIARMAVWDFEVAFDGNFTWGDPIIGVHRTYDSSNIRKGILWANTQGYRNARIDTLINQAAIELDFEKRKTLYKEFQQIIADEIPVYGLYELPIQMIHHKDLMNLSQSIWGDGSPMNEVYWRKTDDVE